MDPALRTDRRLFLGDRATGALASLVSLYYPWAAEIGAAEPRFAERHDASVGPAFRLGETSTGRA